jgi:hypothetical protein
MNLIGFTREPDGGFYLRLRGSCRLLSHSSASLQLRVPKATAQGIPIRASAPYTTHKWTQKLGLMELITLGLIGNRHKICPPPPLLVAITKEGFQG